MNPSVRVGRPLPAPTLDVQRSELRCGARLLVSPRAGAPVCAVQLHLRGAVAADPAGREGAAYLTGALGPEGTARHTEEELADLLEPYGGTLSGEAGALSGTIAGPHWRALLSTFAAVASEPVYPAAQLARRRQVLLDRLAVEADDPRIQASRRFRRLVYGEHWLGRPERGTPESVARITRRDLCTLHRRTWVGRRATLAVCGDVDPEEVRRSLDRHLARWPAGRAAPEDQQAFPAPGHHVAAFPAERQQVHVYLGHLGIRRNHPDYAAVTVLDHVLGTGPGFSNRIAARLRDAEGLAYTVHASQHDSAGTLPGLFTSYIATAPGKLDRALGGFVEEIERIREQLVEPAELELAQSYLIGSYVLGFERAKSRTSYLLFADRVGLPDSDLETLPRAFAAVTREDLRRVARRCLRPDHLCLAAAGPVTQQSLERSLRRALRGRTPNIGRPHESTGASPARSPRRVRAAR
jgi:zinc protease